MRRTLVRAGLQPVDWPVLVPPQVETFAPLTAPIGRAVRLKNRYADPAHPLAAMTNGHAVIGSDLDVVATRVTR